MLTDGNDDNKPDAKMDVTMDGVDAVDGTTTNGTTNDENGADRKTEDVEKMDVEPVEYKNGDASSPEHNDQEANKENAMDADIETQPEKCDQSKESTKSDSNGCDSSPKSPSVIATPVTPVTPATPPTTTTTTTTPTQMESTRQKRLRRPTKIGGVIERLIVRASEQPQSVTTTQTGLGFSFSPAQQSRSSDLMHSHQHVSPRKRFLREFEKVSLEDRQSSGGTQKRSRSKCGQSHGGADFTANTNHNSHSAKSLSTFTFGTAKENGRHSPHKRLHTMDNSGSESSYKHAKSHEPSSSPPQAPVSKPISNYSIISLLGHNSSNASESSSKYENNHHGDEKAMNESHQSPRSPSSYNHQSASRSAFVSKKRSPTNHCGGGSLMGSPVNYRNARSPDINSPSPGLQSSSLHRYHSNLSSATSMSSPTSR